MSVSESGYLDFIIIVLFSKSEDAATRWGVCDGESRR